MKSEEAQTGHLIFIPQKYSCGPSVEELRLILKEGGINVLCDFLGSKRKETRIWERDENEKLCIALPCWILCTSHLQATPASASP